MGLKRITLEGDAKYEKAQGLVPIRWKAHHVTELLLELCPGLNLDGSSYLYVGATRDRRNYGG